VDSKYFPDAIVKDQKISAGDKQELSKRFSEFKNKLATGVLTSGESDGIYQNYEENNAMSTEYAELLKVFKPYFEAHFEKPDDTYNILFEDEELLNKELQDIKPPKFDPKIKPLWERMVKVLFLLLKSSNKNHNEKVGPETTNTFIGLSIDKYSTPSVRFREQYYWDSYFQTVGYLAIGKLSEAKDMLTNFLGLIEIWFHSQCK